MQCDDLDDVHQTVVGGGPAIQGGDLEVTVSRNEDSPTVAVDGLVVTVNGAVAVQLPTPVVGAPLGGHHHAPEQRRVRVTFTWAQGPSLIGSACVGTDEYTFRALVDRERFARYLGGVRAVQREWERTLFAYARCGEDLNARDVETYVRGARCLSRVRGADRSLRLYRAITAPQASRRSTKA